MEKEKNFKKNGIQVVSGVLKNITSKLYSGYILNKKYVDLKLRSRLLVL